MTLTVRRAIVENGPAGKAVIADDAQIAAIAAGADTGISGSELWSADMMPVDNSPAQGARQKAGVIKEHGGRLFIGNGQGSAFRVTAFPAGHTKIFHRTATLDLDLILAGEIDMELDGGETLTLKTGDSVVVRGAAHAWINRKSETALVAFVMLDAMPVSIDGTELGTEIPLKSATGHH